MVRVGNLTKSVALITVVQTLCLALGLWIHQRLVVSAARWSGNESTWQELVDTGDEAAAPLLPLRPGNMTVGTDDFDVAKSLFDALALPKHTTALVVDSQWRVVMTSSNSGEKTENSRRQSNFVSWVGPTDFAGSPRKPNEGTLQTPDGPRRTLAYRLTGGDGYVLFSLTEDAGELSVSALLQALSLAGPISFIWICVVQSIVVFAISSHIQGQRSRERSKSSEETLRRMQDLVRTRDAVIFGLAKLAESRDRDTGGHLERISLYSTRLSSAARGHPKFRDAITPSFIRLIGISSALHDIGKVGIRDSVLLKPGSLDDDERRHVQTHPVIGGECLCQIEQRLGASNFLEMAREIAFSHHEWWDGSGYPQGTEGEQIPLAARIVAIADVYDAMSVRRIYKEPIPHEQCVAYIREQAGKHFDPNLAETFLKIESQFRDIALSYAAAPTVDERSTAGPDRQTSHQDESPPTEETISEAVSQLIKAL